MIIINNNFDSVNILYSDAPKKLNYYFIDLTLLNEYKIIITMKNTTGYYYSIFSFPKCINLSIFI